MKLKVNDKLFEIVLSFAAPGTPLPWQAEAYKISWSDWSSDRHGIISAKNEVPHTVASGTTPGEALHAVAIELSEVVK